MLTVNIRERDGGERRLVFGNEEVTIGRAKGSDILLPKNNISKRHARLVDRDEKVVLVDLRSTNGTYVNGRRITAPEVVGPKDKIYIGDFVLKVESVASPEHEHTMPQEPISETAMMDPAPLDDDLQGPSQTEGDAPAEAAMVAADEAIEPLEIEEVDSDDESVQGPTTDPGKTAQTGEDDEMGEPSITADDIFDDDYMETSVLDLEEMGISPDEAEEVGLAPTQHRGSDDLGEEADAEDPGEEADAEDTGEEADAVEPAKKKDGSRNTAPMDTTGDPVEAQDDDDGVEFEEFEINLADVEAEAAELDAPDETKETAEESAAPETADADDGANEPKEQPVVDAPALTVDAIDAMLGDVTVDGILINAHDAVVVCRGHASTVIPGAFASQGDLEAVADTLAKRAGFDGVGQGMLDGVLPGGVSLNILPSPLAPQGPVVILRRATAKTVTAEELTKAGTLTKKATKALQEAVEARRNILVVGDRSVGRTSVLNALAHFVPSDERLALIEDAQELTVPQQNALRLDKNALTAAGESFLDIVPQLMADRVLIDPVSAEDVVEFIGLALDGHDGMIATVRGRSAETVLRRMSLAVELAVGASLGERARDMVAEAVDLIVVVDRADGGIVIREIVSVDDAGEFGFRTSEILANS